MTTSTGSGWLINPGTTPVVYTDDGRSLGAGERIHVDSLDATGQRMVALKFLKFRPDPITGSGDSADSEEESEGSTGGSGPMQAKPGPSSKSDPRSAR